jgi:hypothetical protein
VPFAADIKLGALSNGTLSSLVIPYSRSNSHAKVYPLLLEKDFDIFGACLAAWKLCLTSKIDFLLHSDQVLYWTHAMNSLMLCYVNIYLTLPFAPIAAFLKQAIWAQGATLGLLIVRKDVKY